MRLVFLVLLEKMASPVIKRRVMAAHRLASTNSEKFIIELISWVLLNLIIVLKTDPNDGWCDDPKSKLYNQFINFHLPKRREAL